MESAASLARQRNYNKPASASLATGTYLYLLSVSLLPSDSPRRLEGPPSPRAQRVFLLAVGGGHKRYAYVAGSELKLNPANVTDGYIRSLVCGRMSSPFCVHGIGPWKGE